MPNFSQAQKNKLLYVGGGLSLAALVGLIVFLNIWSDREEEAVVKQEIDSNKHESEVSESSYDTFEYDDNGVRQVRRVAGRRHRKESNGGEDGSTTNKNRNRSNQRKEEEQPQISNLSEAGSRSPRGKTQLPTPPTGSKEPPVSSERIEDPFLKRNDQRDAQHRNLFPSRKRRFLEECKNSFTKLPLAEMSVLQTSFTELLAELKEAKKSEPSFEDLEIKESTILKDFLTQYFRSILNEMITKYDALLREACASDNMKTLKSLFEAWRKWLTTLNIDLASASEESKSKAEWLVFTKLSEVEAWCKTQPKTPKPSPKVEPLGDEEEASDSEPGAVKVNFKDGTNLSIRKPTSVLVARKSKSFNYGLQRNASGIESVEFFGKKYDIEPEDANKPGIVFENNCLGASVLPNIHENKGKLPIHLSQLKEAWIGSSLNSLPVQYSDPDYRLITLRFTNLQVPIPEHSRFISPVGKTAKSYPAHRFAFIEKLELQSTSPPVYSNKTGRGDSGGTSLNHITGSYLAFEKRYCGSGSDIGIEIGNYVFELPWYVIGCKNLVMETIGKYSDLRREEIKDCENLEPIDIGKYKWKIYENPESPSFNFLNEWSLILRVKYE